MTSKTTERIKKTAEVFTPPWLAQQMLEKIDPAKFQDAHATFFDPACGNGNFLIEIVAKKRQRGATALEALATTYGVDIMPDNVVECRRRVFMAAAQDDDLDYHSERNPLKRFIKKRMLGRMQRLVCKNIRHGDSLKFELEDIFSDEPSQELISFRNENQDFITLDSDD